MSSFHLPRARATRVARAISLSAVTVVLGLLSAGAASGQALPERAPIARGSLPPMPAVRWEPEPAGIGVDTIARNLEIIAELAFAPDGRLFVAERPGRVRVVSRDGELADGEWLDVVERIYLSGESGIMGLALHPNFATQPYVYVMYSIQGVEGYPFDRVSRFRDENGTAGMEEVILDSIPAARTEGNNRGGTIAFGPDGMLYVSLGDNFQRRADDPDVLFGKILRVSADGSIPADNPSRESPVWAHGFRNVRGMAWDPGSGQLFVADHGPSGEDGIRGYDRIIAVQKGRHHGWPDFAGASGDPDYVDPMLVFENASPPGDLAFFQDALYMSVLGFTAEGGHDLVRIELQEGAGAPRASSIVSWFNDAEGNSLYGRLRGMAVGPDGSLYVGTSNRDYRSDRLQGDDKILKLTPR